MTPETELHAETLADGGIYASPSDMANGTSSLVDSYARPGEIRYAPSIARGIAARGQGSALQQTLVMLLAGGQGERLYPLTRDRAKPAVPFGGVYRIIDFGLSNCINSGLRRVLVLTQYKSFSLQRHIQDAWNPLFNPVFGEYIDVIPPQQRNVKRWYQGTADAIFQNIYMLQQERPKYVVILSGDHIYKMDYAKMLDFHLKNGADLTVSCTRVPRQEASRFGIAGADASGRITHFVEKPKDPPAIPGDENFSYGSMGVYIFNTDTLVRRLIADMKQDTEHDFGKNIIPDMVQDGDRVFAYPFVDENKGPEVYWRDIGTIASYYDANMDLTSIAPQFNLYDDEWPIHRRNQPGPPAKTLSYAANYTEAGPVRCAEVEDTLLATGVIISGAKVRRSILGPRVFVHSWAQVEDSILFDDVEIGRHCRIKNAIIDKHVKLPAGTVIGEDPEHDAQRFTVSPEGVVVLPSGLILK
jgi:glucose-1-phosphate adenylyltransferase